MSGYRDQKKCDNCGQWLDPLEKCGCLSTTPPPAPAGEREAFTQEDFNKFTEWYERQKDMPLEGMGRGWRIWKQARASSPAPALGMTEAMRGIAAEIISIMQTYDEQEAEGCVDTPGGLEHMGDVWRLLDAWRKRLTTPADGEGDRLTHESADAPDERTAMELRYGLREEDLP